MLPPLQYNPPLKITADASAQGISGYDQPTTLSSKPSAKMKTIWMERVEIHVGPVGEAASEQPVNIGLGLDFLSLHDIYILHVPQPGINSQLT